MSKNHVSNPPNNDPNALPVKPADKFGFKKAVAWFGGRELIASLKGMIVYGIYGENFDPRSWMKANIYPNIIEKAEDQKKLLITEQLLKQSQNEQAEQTSSYLHIVTEANKKAAEPRVQDEIAESADLDWTRKIYDQWKWKKDFYEVWDEISQKNPDFWSRYQPQNNEIKEFWFDYIADSGDGQLGVYNVACLCLSDLWIDDKDSVGDEDAEVSFYPPKDGNADGKTLLPRGAFLFIGGDTAYHASNYATLVERIQHPFTWAFTSVRDFTAKHYRLRKLNEINSVFFKLDEIEVERKIPGSISGVSKDIDNSENEINYTDVEPTRPIFGLPANHDYYDGIDGFNRQFRRPPFENIEENMFFDKKGGTLLLQIPTFSRKQEASYLAIRLPFDWWYFGIDSENEKLDFRQKLYFQEIIKKQPKKLILATPEPTTVFGKQCDPTDKTAIYLDTITEALKLSQPFLTGGKLLPRLDINEPVAGDDENKANYQGEYCRLDLSGDVHHYARYWGKDTKNFGETTDKFSSDNYASLVAGGGGAFFDITETLIGRPADDKGEPIFKDKNIRGEIPPQRVFPRGEKSIGKTADRIFDFLNIRGGGYIQNVGLVISVIIFYFLLYFSNLSKVFKNHILVDYAGMTSNYYRPLKFTLFLSLAILGLVYWNVRLISGLIETLKTKGFKNELDETRDARIRQILPRYLPLAAAAGIFIYAIYFIFKNIYPLIPVNELDSFLASCILLVNVVTAILLIWLSSEHTNWLNVRFKILSKYKRKPLTEQYEDPHKNLRIPFIGMFLREYSVQYFYPTFLVVAALAFLATTINIFGRGDIAATLSDSLWLIVVFGLLLIIVFVLGYSKGAAYHKSLRYKFLFPALAFWLYVLQISIPFVTFFVGGWKSLIASFVLFIALHGSAIISWCIRSIFDKDNEENSKILNFADYRIAAQLTKKLPNYALLFVWILYGALMLAVPFILRIKVLPSFLLEKESLHEMVSRIIAAHLQSFWLFESFRSVCTFWFSIPIEKFNLVAVNYSIIWISLLIVGYIGFLMSRVWFSWYLAVSMKFDGHNNEAGGAARIEGFKHILRIKIWKEMTAEGLKDRLTVYVIGFDEAKSDMENLELRLVDKFTLEAKPIV